MVVPKVCNASEEIWSVWWNVLYMHMRFFDLCIQWRNIGLNRGMYNGERRNERGRETTLSWASIGCMVFVLSNWYRVYTCTPGMRMHWIHWFSYWIRWRNTAFSEANGAEVEVTISPFHKPTLYVSQASKLFNQWYRYIDCIPVGMYYSLDVRKKETYRYVLPVSLVWTLFFAKSPSFC